MVTSYDKKIKLAHLESRLSGQKYSVNQIELEMLKLNAKLETYQETMNSLKTEIEKTEKELIEERGGE